jgi:hypothetical protein
MNRGGAAGAAATGTGAPWVKPAGRLRGGEGEVWVAAGFGRARWGKVGRRVGGRGGGENGVRHRCVSDSISNGYGEDSEPKQQGVACGGYDTERAAAATPGRQNRGHEDPVNKI